MARPRCWWPAAVAVVAADSAERMETTAAAAAPVAILETEAARVARPTTVVTAEEAEHSAPAGEAAERRTPTLSIPLCRTTQAVRERQVKVVRAGRPAITSS